MKGGGGGECPLPGRETPLKADIKWGRGLAITARAARGSTRAGRPRQPRASSLPARQRCRAVHVQRDAGASGGDRQARQQTFIFIAAGSE